MAATKNASDLQRAADDHVARRIQAAKDAAEGAEKAAKEAAALKDGRP